ncbi:hypothetical protein CL656_06010 [bacterium]|nr:hypothetical protein [bacterium]|tara:strand:+ start:5179 stop:6939 length:1761 start_codon:yes stop_codon:yes gene_type:complete
MQDMGFISQWKYMYKYYLDKKSKGYIAYSLLLGLTSALFEFSSVLLLGSTADKVLGGSPKSQVSIEESLVSIAITLVICLITFVNKIAVLKITNKSSALISNNIVRSCIDIKLLLGELQNLNINYKPIGLSNKYNVLTNQLTTSIANFIYPSLSLITSITILIAISISGLISSPILFVLGLSLSIIFYIFIIYFTRRTANRNSKRIPSLQKDFIASIKELFTWKEDIILSANYKDLFNKLIKDEIELRKLQAENRVNRLLPKPFIDVGIAITILLTCILSLFRNEANPSLLNIASITSVGFAFQKIIPLAQTIFTNYYALIVGKSALAKIIEMTFLTSNKNEQLISNSITNTDFSGREIDIEEGEWYVELRSVSLEHKSTKKLLIYKDVSFKGSGLFVITGKSGSGKSTLLDIISGIKIPTKGRVNFYEKKKGWNNRNFCYDNYQFSGPRIDLLRQDIPLYNGTLLENLIGNSFINLEDKRKLIAQLINAKLDDLVSTLDNNDINLGDKVDALSGGQLRRIGLIRSIFREPEIFLLDEPTSNLDHESRLCVIEIIKKISKTKMVIVSTHDTNLIDIAQDKYDISQE